MEIVPINEEGSSEEIEFDEVKEANKPSGLGKKSPSRWIAWLMDEVIEVPGTDIKIGLDPIMGLLPGGGDFASAAVSCVGLVEAMRRGLPVKKLWQVIGNILTNAGVGTLPVIGDFFSLIFRSNSRNRDIINDWLKEADAQEIQGSWFPIILVVSFIMLIALGAVVMNLLLWALVAGTLSAAVSGLLN